MRIAMVCLGNICRSPMAEAVARAMVEQAGLEGEVTVESFGTAAYHTSEGADPRAEAALRRRGWPVGAHRARRIAPEDVEAADLVLCADRSNVAEVLRIAGPGTDRDKVRLLRCFDPSSTPEDDEVPDPWYGQAREFDAALRLIERSCAGLLEHLGATLPR